MQAAPRPDGIRGEFLWEFEIVERQLMALAEVIPPEKYDWRPGAKARAVREVLVHVASGNFMLLDVAGVAAPADLYGGLTAQGPERFLDLIRRNDELIDTLREKGAVTEILKRSFGAVSGSLHQATDAQLERRLHFFGEETTIRRVYLRVLAHSHEHMGQMIAYVRLMGMSAPWPDWRPDRREP